MSKLKIGLLLVCVALCQTIFAEVVEIDEEGLKQLMAAGVPVIDVRTPGEWNKTGIVGGSIPIMFFDEKRKPQAQQWMQEAEEYIQPEREVAIICRTGNRSKTVADFLTNQHGYKKVYNVTGGITNWLAKGNKTVEVK